MKHIHLIGIGGTGNIAGISGARKNNLAYLTQADKNAGIGRGGPSVLQYGARKGALETIGREMGAQGRATAKGGLQALGASNQMIAGSIAAGTQADIVSTTPAPKISPVGAVTPASRAETGVNVILPSTNITFNFESLNEFFNNIQRSLVIVKNKFEEISTQVINAGATDQSY